MIYKNTEQLTRWLSESGIVTHKTEFELDFAEYAKHLKGVQSRPESERKDAAAFRCLTMGKTSKPAVQPSPEPAPVQLGAIETLLWVIAAIEAVRLILDVI